MTSIKLQNVCLDYIVKSGTSSLKKSIVHLARNCLRIPSTEPSDIKNSTYRALNNINLELKPGDRVGLLGRNGAGKSTMLRVLARVYKPNLGKINIEGEITTLFDVTAGMNIESTGYENIMNLCIVRKIPKQRAQAMFSEIEQFTELGDFLNQPVRTYSAGMQMKLAFGVATSLPSEIMLVDEIIGAGDEHFLEKARNRLGEMIERSQILVMASHSNEIIKRFCNKAIVLDRGNVQFFGNVDRAINLYTHSHQPNVKQKQTAEALT